MKEHLSFNFSAELGNVFVDIFLPKSKPILVGILYNHFKPDFLDKFSAAFGRTEIVENQEVYMLGNFNINLWHDGKYIFQDDKFISSNENA